MAKREFGTCFFEQYAQISLSALLGSDYDCLVNRDRPDLQSSDGHSMGIEVTRAMEESRKAHLDLLKDISGITPSGREEETDLGRIVEFGYGYGLRKGRFVGARELSYWSMALPMQRIIESKVHKNGDGFYGTFDQMGLFIFSHDNLLEPEALKAMNYTMSLQKNLERRYDRLYLADVDDLFVCNLEEGLSEASRLVRIAITREQRQSFYMEAIRRQNA
ncbi:MAG: hypothetical protein IJT26_06405 [Bacteroidales bacterium]|nr:hypothetical protein [Bacteroidales bacterium]